MSRSGGSINVLDCLYPAFALILAVPLFAVSSAAGEAAADGRAKTPWRVAAMQDRIRLPDGEPDSACRRREIKLDVPAVFEHDGFAVVVEHRAGHWVAPTRRDGDRVRFAWPDGIVPDSLWLYFNGPFGPDAPRPAPFDEDKDDNLLATALNNPAAWSAAPDGAVAAEAPNGVVAAGLRFSSIKRSETIFVLERPLPLDVAGADAHLDFELRAASSLPFIVSLRVGQLDAEGKELPSAAIDERWLRLVAPTDKNIQLRQSGFLDPRARSLRLALSLRGHMEPFDAAGLPLAAAEAAAAVPSLSVSRLALRAGRRLLPGGYNPHFFAEGVDGESLRLDGRTGFLFNAAPARVWSEGKKLSEAEEYHWPVGAGTVEFSLCPDEGQKGELTLLEAFQHNRKGILRLLWKPADGTLILRQKDFGDRAAEASAPVVLTPGTWSHVAVCWDDSTRKVFLDGKAVIDESGIDFQYADLAAADRPDRLMPNEICLGVPAALLYQSVKEDNFKRFPPLRGRVDNLRVSRVARYADDFVPPRQPENDDNTCALFRFENELDGVHGAGDGRVEHALFSPTPPRPETLNIERREGGARSVRRVPESLLPANDPRALFDPNNFPPPPAPEDFSASRVVAREVFDLAPGEEKLLNYPDDAVLDYIEIHCPPESRGFVAPAILANGEADPRSFAGIARGLSLSLLKDERERVLSLFRYALAKTDYFMVKPAEFFPHSRRQNRVNYDSLSLLNAYGVGECGPFNSLLINLFVNSAGLPASALSGNEHAFEQVYYNGGWRLYDLSAQTFFPGRDKTDAASLEEVEKDPWLLGIHGSSSPRNFYRRGQRGQGYIPASSNRIFAVPLRPGESLRFHTLNNGDYLDLQSDWGGVNLAAMGREVGDEIQSDRETWRADRILPEFSTGVLSADWTSGQTETLFDKKDANGFVYRIDTPYPLVGLRVETEPSVPVEYSVDGGKTWEEPRGILMRGRRGMMLRVKTDPDRLRSFRSRAYLQMNVRALTGAPRPGQNTLRFVDAGATETNAAPARIALQYRRDAAPIEIHGAVRFGIGKGLEKRLLVLDPDQTLEVPLSGVGQDARVEVPEYLSAKIAGGKLTLRCRDYARPALAPLTVVDGPREQRATVLVCPGAMLLTAGQISRDSLPDGVMFKDDYPTPYLSFGGKNGKKSSFVVNLPEPVSGDFAFLTLARYPDKRFGTSGALFQYKDADGKDRVLIRRRNLATEFLKAEIGPLFHWAFPQTGNYPYQYIDLIALRDAGSLTIQVVEPKADFAALLLIPTTSRQEVYDLLKFFICLNYLPGAVE